MVRRAHLETYRLHHPAPHLRDLTLLPPPPASPEKQPTPPRRPKLAKPGRHTLNSLLAGVAIAKKKRCKISREYARSHNMDPESEIDTDLPKKPKTGKLNIKDFVIRCRKTRKSFQVSSL